MLILFIFPLINKSIFILITHCKKSVYAYVVDYTFTQIL